MDHKNLNFYDNECYQEIQFVREINRRIIRLKISPNVNLSMFLDNITVFVLCIQSYIEHVGSETSNICETMSSLKSPAFKM